MNRSTLFNLNTGAAAKGRGTAQKHLGTGRRKTNTAEGKVKAQDTSHLHCCVTAKGGREKE